MLQLLKSENQTQISQLEVKILLNSSKHTVRSTSLPENKTFSNNISTAIDTDFLKILTTSCKSELKFQQTTLSAFQNWKNLWNITTGTENIHRKPALPQKSNLKFAPMHFCHKNPSHLCHTFQLFGKLNLNHSHPEKH